MSMDIDSMLTSSADFVLDSKYEIENVLIEIQQIEDKAKFFKELKQYRAKKVEQDIKELEDRADRLRQAILRTMISTDPSKKTMHFPGVGKVTRRTGKKTWKIKDEDKMLAFLEQEGIKNQVVETKEVVSKKEANKVFECYNDQGTVVPGVERKDAAEGISISYEDEDTEVAPIKAAKATKAKASTAGQVEQLAQGIDEFDL